MIPPQIPSFWEAARVWARIGLLSFGGPAGQIALMHKVLVEERGWIGERRFLHALNYCMLLPGPEAQQLATYIGWLLHKTAGGLVAGLLFVLPGALVMWTLMALGALVVFSVIPFDKPIFVAMLLAFSMPAPFIIPLYADVTGHADYISTTLSVQTLISIALFIAISVYTLA